MKKFPGLEPSLVRLKGDVTRPGVPSVGVFLLAPFSLGLPLKRPSPRRLLPGALRGIPGKNRFFKRNWKGTFTKAFSHYCWYTRHVFVTVLLKDTVGPLKVYQTLGSRAILGFIVDDRFVSQGISENMVQLLFPLFFQVNLLVDTNLF